MAINIIDGFSLGNSLPIDYRLVVNNLTERDNLSFKYDGLISFVKSENKFYSWYDGQWNEFGVNDEYLGSENIIPKFSNSGLIESNISNNSNGVGIFSDDSKSELQIESKNEDSIPFNIGFKTDYVYIGFNYYEDIAPNIHNSLLPSSVLKVGTDGYLDFVVKNDIYDYDSLFKINDNGYNRLNLPTSINTSLSISNATHTFNKMLNVDGSVKLNGGLFYNTTVIRVGSTTTVNYININGSNNTINSSSYNTQYTLTDNDSNIVVYYLKAQSGTYTINLPSLSNSELGREINLMFESIDGFNTSLSINLGSTTTIIKSGVNIKFIATLDSSLNRIWKIQSQSVLMPVGNDVNSIFYSSNNSWGVSNFNTVMRDNLKNMVENYIVDFTSGNLSHIIFPKTTYSYIDGVSSKSEIKLVASNYTNSDIGLNINHNFVNSNNSISSIFSNMVGSNSTNNVIIGGNATYSNIYIKNDLSIFDTNTSSILVKSKEGVEIVSDKGVYYLGQRNISGEDESILPVKINGYPDKIKLLTIDENTGQIKRALYVVPVYIYCLWGTVFSCYINYNIRGLDKSRYDVSFSKTDNITTLNQDSINLSINNNNVSSLFSCFVMGGLKKDIHCILYIREKNNNVYTGDVHPIRVIVNCLANSSQVKGDAWLFPEIDYW